MGQDYLIVGFDQDHGVATAELTDLPYSTHPQSVHDTRLLQVVSSDRWGAVGISYGVVEVSSRVTSFLKRRVSTGAVIGTEPLDLPVRTLRTKAVWWSIPDAVVDEAEVPESALPGAAHAAEHAAIGMLPLFAHCDRWDVGGLSSAHHPDTGMCTIVVHDGLPGGAGFAERGFAAASPWWRSTLRVVSECGCSNGCPTCVQSPKCGNGNEPLDKAAAVRLITALLRHAPLEMGPPPQAPPGNLPGEPRWARSAPRNGR
jgi:DEAD/DEAH box helicase domain-containing protein